jgi:WXXGXW repeat (2 copies)
MLKRMAITSLAAAAAFSTATVFTAPFTPADAQLSITFGSPPPPMRYEAVPAPRSGYVWAAGHYELVNDQYVWRPGQWMTARPGYRYVAPRWAQVGNRWQYTPSRWDRDGDGIPNRYDRTDNRNGPYGDRDHDGIPNKYDRHDNRSQAQNPFGDRDHDGIPNAIDGYNNYRR